MVTKADLHRLIDALPEPALPVAERFLAQLEADEAAPLIPLHEAPPDDEPETEAELAAVAEARAAIARGEVISDEDLARELRL
ncbi:MAG: hypothetical protein ACYDCQ_16620 [Dehalococcoidia bacterium]